MNFIRWTYGMLWTLFALAALSTVIAWVVDQLVVAAFGVVVTLSTVLSVVLYTVFLISIETVEITQSEAAPQLPEAPPANHENEDWHQ